MRVRKQYVLFPEFSASGNYIPIAQIIAKSLKTSYSASIDFKPAKRNTRTKPEKMKTSCSKENDQSFGIISP